MVCAVSFESPELGRILQGAQGISPLVRISRIPRAGRPMKRRADLEGQDCFHRNLQLCGVKLVH